jgi:nicotinamidase-related amidase
MKPALLVIDMQERYYARSQGATRECWDRAIGCTNAAIDLFRARGLPIYVIEHLDGGFGPDAADFPTVSNLDLDPSMPRVRKTTGSVFASTDLEKTLRKEGVTALVCTGYAAENCVLSTVRHAKDLGLGPMILQNSLASRYIDRIRFVEEINDSLSLGALATILK